MPKVRKKSKHLSLTEIQEALVDSDDDLPPIDIRPEDNHPDTRTQTEFITRELPVFIGGRVRSSAIDQLYPFLYEKILISCYKL